MFIAYIRKWCVVQIRKQVKLSRRDLTFLEAFPRQKLYVMWYHLVI